MCFYVNQNDDVLKFTQPTFTCSSSTIETLEKHVKYIQSQLDKVDVVLLFLYIFFSNWVFFHKHSLFTGQQGKGEDIFLTPLCHFHPLHRHLNIRRAITAESSPQYIASSRTRTGYFWFLSASR